MKKLIFLSMAYRRSARDVRLEAPVVESKKGRKKRILAKNPKVIDFDRDSYLWLQAAADTLGLTESAFVRLAVHRAVEDIVVLYKESLEAEARRQVDDVARLYYRSRSHGKSGVLKAAVETDEGYRQMVERLQGLRFSIRDIISQLEKRHVRRSPKNWGPLVFRGNQLEQNAAALLLGSEERRKEGRELLGLERRVCLEESILGHIQRWILLKKLQDDVVHKLFDNPGKPGTEETFYRDMVRRIDDALRNKQEFAPAFVAFIREHSGGKYQNWQKSKQKWRSALKNLRERSYLSAEVETRNRRRALKKLQTLKSDPSQWLNPVALEKMLLPAPSSVFKPKRVSLWPRQPQ